MIIAIDGPAASGKGTLAKRLAVHYGLRHLDTGLLYRAVAKAVLDAGRQPSEHVHAVAAAKALDPSRFDETALKSPQVGEASSIVSSIPEVRTALLDFQRRFAATPPGAVLDGRDIGTVVFPDAELKVFLTASAEERARRRLDEAPAGEVSQHLGEEPDRDPHRVGDAALRLSSRHNVPLVFTVPERMVSARTIEITE